MKRSAAKCNWLDSIVRLFYSFVKCHSAETANKAIKEEYKYIFRVNDTSYILGKERFLILFFNIFGQRHRIDKFCLTRIVSLNKTINSYS